MRIFKRKDKKSVVRFEPKHIHSHADIAARIATASYVLGDDETMGEKFGEEDTENLTKLFKLISLSSSMSCISTLFNLGLLESKAVHDGK
jgi:hypothetical protein